MPGYQPGLRRRPRDHEGRGLGADGHRPGERRESRRRGRPAGHREPAARARHPRGQGILWNITGSSNLSLFEVNEAAEAIKEAADPEANIIFGTSFNERLGDEVMVTVVATGFDGGKRKPAVQREAAGVMEGAASSRVSHERDFLQELERQREQGSDGMFSPAPARDEEPAVTAPRVERTAASRPPPSSDDIRRRRPRDPELPAPQVIRAGTRPATDP
jgi:hypothetical protein